MSVSERGFSSEKEGNEAKRGFVGKEKSCAHVQPVVRFSSSILRSTAA